MASLLGAKTALTARGTPGLVTWRSLGGGSTPRPAGGPYTQLRPGAIPGRRYGNFTKAVSSTALVTAFDTASLSATEDPIDQNEIATTDTARLSASDVSQLFNRLDLVDTATLTAGETIALLQSGVILKTPTDTASLSATDATAVGVTVDVSDTATLTASDSSSVAISAQSLSVTDTADLSADDTYLLEIFAGIVEKITSDTARLSTFEIAAVSEVRRIRKMVFEVRKPRMSFKVP